MLISIVTPSYNQGRFIGRTLRSVLAQEGPSEHIVVDGGSSDETVDILRSAPETVRWVSEKDEGQTDALNRGMARATGDIVGWINSDDFYLPGCFASVRQRFLAADRPDIVFGYTVQVDEAGRLTRENRFPAPTLRKLVFNGTELNQQALFWRRELNATVFPLAKRLRFCMDIELFYRLLSATERVGLVPDFLGAFRVHGSSKTSTISEVGRREHAELSAQFAAEHGIARPLLPAGMRRVVRRLEFICRGEIRYALLGGRIGLSRRARYLAGLS